ncbi:MAG: hypothetical protein KAH31_06285 [Candidatus Sabulitectum sp.]|nr:hypothetical protein [Candidatus Sabulitectum sp.]
MRCERGSALAMVVVVAAVLFILTGVVYTYSQMNARTVIFKMNRIRAATAAEAGTALALHHLSFMESVPADGEPFVLSMEGDSSGWIGLPDCGKFFVVIDPVNWSTGLCSNRAVEIRSRGISGDVTRDINIKAAPAFPSSYALLTEDGIPEGYFVDGRVVDGPVHSNGIIHFSSYSPDSTEDPYVSMISTTSRGGFRFAGAGISDIPHPAGSSIWVRPFTRHRQGSPYWQATSSEIDFEHMAEHFRSFVSGSHSGQSDILRISAERILVEGGRLLIKENQNAPQRTVDLEGINLIIVRNGFSSVMVKTIRRPDHPMTIIATHDLALGGGIDGGVVGSGGPLGLVALGDIVIPADPDETGGSDWPGRWEIETDRAFLVRACLAAPSGSLKALVPYSPTEQTRLTVAGSLVERTMGRLSSGNSGYQLGNSWDQGLGVQHPPYFPMLRRWNTYSWIIDPPEMEDYNIEDDRF